MKRKYLEPQVSVDLIRLEQNFLVDSYRDAVSTTNLDVEDVDDDYYWND